MLVLVALMPRATRFRADWPEAPPRGWRHSGYGWFNAMSLGAQMRRGDDAAPPLPAATVRASAVDNPRNPTPTVGNATSQARFQCACLPDLNFADKAELSILQRGL